MAAASDSRKLRMKWFWVLALAFLLVFVCSSDAKKGKKKEKKALKAKKVSIVENKGIGGDNEQEVTEPFLLSLCAVSWC